VYVIATGLVGLASVKVAHDAQVDSRRAELVRGDRTELLQVLDTIVTDLAHPLDVGTNSESDLSLAQVASPLLCARKSRRDRRGACSRQGRRSATSTQQRLRVIGDGYHDSRPV
jgi:hypothetical protein